MKPSEVVLHDPIMMVDALGNTETEVAAALVVLWHRDKGLDDWTPVTRATIIDWLTSKAAEDPFRGALRNPFWKPNPNRLRDEGWITGWTNADDPGVFTEKALRCIAQRGLWKTERGEAVRS